MSEVCWKSKASAKRIERSAPRVPRTVEPDGWKSKASAKRIERYFALTRLSSRCIVENQKPQLRGLKDRELAENRPSRRLVENQKPQLRGLKGQMTLTPQSPQSCWKSKASAKRIERLSTPRCHSPPASVENQKPQLRGLKVHSCRHLISSSGLLKIKSLS